jgi:hypothetical protein
MNFNGWKYMYESVECQFNKHATDRLWKIIITKEEKKCYHEIATDAPKWNRAVKDSISLRKVIVFTAQMEQPI